MLLFAINTHSCNDKEETMTIHSPTFQQQTGLAYDSSNFAMNFSATGTTLTPHSSVTMEDWDTEEDDREEERIPKPEIDPDLEDGDEDEDTTPAEGGEDVYEDDDDEFEQYLFGEDDD